MDKTLGGAIDEMVQALGSLDESSRVTAIRAVCEHLKIRIVEFQPEQRPPTSPAVERTPGSSATPPPRAVDIKTFRQEKQPTSANEMAALVAFYLSELASDDERKGEVQTEDMTKYFKQAGFPLPKHPNMLLTNAKNAGYFDSVGGGRLRLNPVGYNLIAHSLPRGASGPGSAPRRRKPSTTNKKARAKKSK